MKTRSREPDLVIVTGGVSGVRKVGYRLAAEKIDRKLRSSADEPRDKRNPYDLDARDIARVLVRHFGDEAEAVLERTKLFLNEARRTKR